MTDIVNRSFRTLGISSRSDFRCYLRVSFCCWLIAENHQGKLTCFPGNKRVMWDIFMKVGFLQGLHPTLHPVTPGIKLLTAGYCYLKHSHINSFWPEIRIFCLHTRRDFIGTILNCTGYPKQTPGVSIVWCPRVRSHFRSRRKTAAPIIDDGFD